MAISKESTSTTNGGKTVVVMQRLSVFQAFFQKAPNHKVTGMTWEEAVKNLFLLNQVTLFVEQRGKSFTARFETKTSPFEGYGLSEGSAIKDLLGKRGFELHVHYEVSKLSDLLETG